MAELEFYCELCNANWSAGDFSPDCKCCGGGALERACPICDGECGQVWRRARIDSQDSKEAHWYGSCAAVKGSLVSLMNKE